MKSATKFGLAVAAVAVSGAVVAVHHSKHTMDMAQFFEWLRTSDHGSAHGFRQRFSVHLGDDFTAKDYRRLVPRVDRNELEDAYQFATTP